MSFCPQTHALSIYNAVSMAGRDLRRSEIVNFLRQAWLVDFSEDDFAAGLEYLTGKNMVTVTADDDPLVQAPSRGANGRAPIVQRATCGLELIRIEGF